MTNEKLPWSPLAVLTNQKDVPPKQELLYYSDWSPFKGHNLMEIASSARLFNIFQVPAEQVRNSIEVEWNRVGFYPGTILNLVSRECDTGKPASAATCIRQATFINQVFIQLYQRENTLKSTCIKQAPVLSKHILTTP